MTAPPQKRKKKRHTWKTHLGLNVSVCLRCFLLRACSSMRSSVPGAPQNSIFQRKSIMKKTISRLGKPRDRFASLAAPPGSCENYMKTMCKLKKNGLRCLEGLWGLSSALAWPGLEGCGGAGHLGPGETGALAWNTTFHRGLQNPYENPFIDGPQQPFSDSASPGTGLGAWLRPPRLCKTKKKRLAKL